MSLVERAGKRLEELRRAGSQLAGDLAFPTRDAGDQEGPPPTIIEQAVQRADARRPGVDWPAQPAERVEPDRPPASLAARGARREPRLTSAAAGAQARPPSTVHIDLDFELLATRGYITPAESESVLANQFRKVKWPLIQACLGKGPARVQNANRIMVTSSVPGEGKSFIAMNLALSIAAERDHRVLLIDADTTRPSLSRLLGISEKFGLLDLLAAGSRDYQKALIQTNVERLAVISTGPRRGHATELLASEDMGRLVQDLASEYTDRILIFDTPPLLAAPEPAVLASYMGQLLVVVEADRTTQETLKSALATVEACPVVRMLLNKAATTERYSYAG